MNFTELIEPTMKKKGITAYKICKDLKISQTTYSGWKSGRQPALEKAIEILRYLDMSADKLFNLKQPEYTPKEKEIISKYRNYNIHQKELLEAYMDLLGGEKHHDTEDARLYG